ncbi:MAG: glutathione S-transferase C-terminal domain-containing protein [Myxococcota bacterium]
MSTATSFHGCVVYGWPVSPYTQKVVVGMRAKGVRFTEQAPSVPALVTTIKRAVGTFVMPTVRMADGSWRQDSAEILDEVDRAHPQPDRAPLGPRQRLASLLLELYADEWLPMTALHYRWNRPANRRFAIDEFARCGFPWLPRLLARPLAARVAARMQAYLPMLGVTERTIPALESRTESLIAALQTHLADQPYLLGARPCRADFALYGPLHAHLFRDPATTALFDAAPAVRAWMSRLTAGAPEPSDYLDSDYVPDTLDPILRALFADQWPYVCEVISTVDAYCVAHPSAPRVPRALGFIPFSLDGATDIRRLLTFTQFKAQRPLDAYRDAPDSARPALDAWLARVGGHDAMGLPIRHRLRREAFRVVRADAPAPPPFDSAPRPREDRGA